MKSNIASILFIILASSCSNELVFENKDFNKKSALLCKKNCSEIKVTIPYAKNNSIASDSINKRIFDAIKDLVCLENKKFEKEEYKMLLACFIHSYETTKEAFPDATFGWDASVRATVKHQSEAILNVEIFHYIFTGGAHGYEGLKSLLFDPKTGKIISNEKLFVNVFELKKVVETKFRTKYQIPSEGSINQTGYWFANNEFQLPKNIFFTKKGVLFYYNSYEIAAYAEGPKTLLLSYDSLKDHLMLK